MLPKEQVEWIERLHAEKKSQRAIHLITGANRRSIARILAGKRREYEDLQRKKQEEELLQLGPVERCPGCGGMVEMPCRACRLRSRLATLGGFRPTDIPISKELALGLNLREAHRARYREVHDRRMRHSGPQLPESHCDERGSRGLWHLV